MEEQLKKAFIRETIDRERTLAKFYKFITGVLIICIIVSIYYIFNIYITLFAILFVILFSKTQIFKPIRKLRIFDFYRPDLSPLFWDCPNCNKYMTLGGAWKCDKCFFVNTTKNNNNSYPRIYGYCHNCMKLQETAFCENCHKEFII